jgi:CRISPR-associated endonuclease Csn1
MRLCKNDLLALGPQDGVRRIMRVVKFSPGQIVLAEHFEAGNLKGRDGDPNDPFKYLTKGPGSLKELRARRVFVDLLGNVKDPGCRE